MCAKANLQFTSSKCYKKLLFPPCFPSAIGMINLYFSILNNPLLLICLAIIQNINISNRCLYPITLCTRFWSCLCFGSVSAFCSGAVFSLNFRPRFAVSVLCSDLVLILAQPLIDFGSGSVSSSIIGFRIKF